MKRSETDLLRVISYYVSPILVSGLLAAAFMNLASTSSLELLLFLITITYGGGLSLHTIISLGRGHEIHLRPMMSVILWFFFFFLLFLVSRFLR